MGGINCVGYFVTPRYIVIA